MTDSIDIRTMMDDDVDALVELSLLAWQPVFDSFMQMMGPRLYEMMWPTGLASQGTLAKSICQDENMSVLVAQVEEVTAGFLAYRLDIESSVGEVYFLGVHPHFQNHGIGTALNYRALEIMREKGMKMAKVETGGDPSHAPARTCYEKAGYRPLPITRYYQEL